jgi:CRP-like cAMP-binding protein
MSVSAPEHQNGFRRRSEDVDVLLPLLQRLHTVRNLPDAAQRALCAVARAVKYQQGDYIYRKDDLSDSSYLVLTGERCGSW